MAVVKSNAYGHGMVEYAKEAKKSGVDFFAVDSIEEALELRGAGIKEPILVLGLCLSGQFSECRGKKYFRHDFESRIASDAFLFESKKDRSRFMSD